MCNFGPFGADPSVWTCQFWLEPVDSTFTLACILEPKINLSWLVHWRTSESNICYDWRYFIHPLNVTETCCIVPVLEAGYNAAGTTTVSIYWNYYYAQLYWTKLIITYEYCWYYRVLGDQTVFWISVDCVVCWLVCSEEGSVMCLYCLILLVWFSNSHNSAVVTDLQQGIDCWKESDGLCTCSKLCLSNGYMSLSCLMPAMSDEAVINDNQRCCLNIVTIISTVK